MISIDRYIRLVSVEAARRGVRDPEGIEWLKAYLNNKEKTASLLKSMEAFQIDPANGREGLLVIYPLSEVKAIFDIADNPKYGDLPYFDLNNWVYDRVLGYVLVNMDMGSHEQVLALLAQAYTPELKRGYIGMKEMADYAEVYIEKGYGWKCSAGSYGRILKSPSVKMTAQEKMVFKDYRIFDL